MKRIKRHTGLIASVIAAAVMLPGLGACSGKKDNAGKTRADYAQSLQDSVTALKAEIDSCNSNIAMLRERQDVWLRDFTTVANEREAAPYMIYTPFKGKYPPASTSLMARLAENGQFELVAACSGKRFNSITVTAPSVSATSDVVPADQALNYMAGNLNVVMFTGTAADSIGHLIADNQLNDITVTFVNNSPVASWKMPLDYSKMIMATYELYASQRDMNAMERCIPMLSRKIDLLRQHIDRSGNNQDKEQK